MRTIPNWYFYETSSNASRKAVREMKLCNNDHDEICFEGRDCPLCDMRKNYESDLQEARETIDDLNIRLSDREVTT